MKKIKIMVLALIGMMTKSMVCKANENMVFAENLPTDAKAFVMHNFPRLSIAYAEMRKTRQGKVYDVSLNDGTELVFSQNGAWGTVDCMMEAVPSSLIPESLSSFVVSNFVNEDVVRLERIDGGECVATLSNGVCLRFTSQEQVA